MCACICGERLLRLDRGSDPRIALPVFGKGKTEVVLLPSHLVLQKTEAEHQAGNQLLEMCSCHLDAF